MAHYEFSVELTVSEIIDIEADSYDEAYDMAMEQAHEFTCLSPEGYAVSWDYVDMNDYLLPEED